MVEREACVPQRDAHGSLVEPGERVSRRKQTVKRDFLNRGNSQLFQWRLIDVLYTWPTTYVFPRWTCKRRRQRRTFQLPQADGSGAI